MDNPAIDDRPSCGVTACRRCRIPPAPDVEFDGRRIVVPREGHQLPVEAEGTTEGGVAQPRRALHDSIEDGLHVRR
jgi:hypothetical protein